MFFITQEIIDAVRTLDWTDDLLDLSKDDPGWFPLPPEFGRIKDARQALRAMLPGHPAGHS